MKCTLYDFLEEENKIYAEYKEENNKKFSYVEITPEEKEDLEQGKTIIITRDYGTIILKL